MDGPTYGIALRAFEIDELTATIYREHYKSVHNRTYIFLSCIEGCLGPKEAANFIRAMC